MPNVAPKELWPGWNESAYDPETPGIPPPYLIRIWTAQWDEISSLQLVPGYELKADVWVVPRAWVVGDSERNGLSRTIHFNSALPEGWERSDQRAELAIRRLKRLAVIMLTQVGWNGRASSKLPKPATWVKCVRAVCRTARLALAADGFQRRAGRCPDGLHIFADLPPRVFNEMREASSSLNHFVGQVNALFRSDIFDDWPAPDVSGVEVESEVYQPFSDQDIASIAKAALWFQEIGSDLLDCWEALHTDSGFVRDNRVDQQRMERLALWKSAKLRPDQPFPFAVKIRTVERHSTSEIVQVWPPRRPSGLRSLITMLQASNMIILLLVTGARDGEIAGLPRDCLEEFSGLELVQGRIFKSSEHPEGSPHAWPLPPQAVHAIELQQRLGRSLWGHRRSLWVPFYNQENAGIGSTHSAVRRFCERVFRGDGSSIAEAVEGSVHPHRFRKSVARYAALALVGANQVLQDVLGHRDPSTTFNYMLSDPELQEEMRVIVHEATIALGVEALSDDGISGPAAKGIAHLRRRLAPRDAESEMELDSLTRAAEILAQNGSLMLVRPNVLCTKSALQPGPCTKRLGSPDIGNCRSSCDHRFELDAAKADHQAAIRQALREGKRATGFMRLWWIDQVAHHRNALRGSGATVPNEAEVEDFLGERSVLAQGVI